LPIWALCIVAAWRRLLPGLFKSRAARILALFVWAALSFYAFDMPNIVTPDMLPTRFADFSFWPARFKALFESFCAAWFMRGSFSALLWTVELIFPVTGFSVLAAAVFGAAGYFHCNASNVSEKNFK
jgi:hypothetical protein